MIQDRAFISELAALEIRRASMEKQALGVGAALLAAGGALVPGLTAHGVSNVLFKTVRGTRLGQKALSRAALVGARHGVRERTLNPVVRRGLETLVGPESLEDYYLGQHVGQGVRRALRGARSNMQPQEIKGLGGFTGLAELGRVASGARSGPLGTRGARAVRLRELGRATAAYPLPRGTPMGYVVKDLGWRLAESPNPLRAFERPGGKRPSRLRSFLRRSNVGRRLAEELSPTVPISKKPTRLQNFLSAGLIGGATALSPSHVAPHIGFTTTRRFLAKHRIGKEFMQRGFDRGMARGGPGRLRSLMFDLGLSPAALDAERWGGGIKQVAQRHNIDLPKVQKVLGDMRAAQG